ncbi:carbohydrate kinase family protein [Winogradskyella poriferorum]|uniref:carbohydrate kinase family protein n=1 Tax=Winogradskyella poriferorum TaxID=307627 RepID=UPI003D64CD44
MSEKFPKVVCFGEILWDVFPTHKVIGGAPLNVALRLHSFGIYTHIISSIGNDNNGKEALNYLNEAGLSTDMIQIDETHNTGYVNVFLDETGSATYQIFKPVAWDNIQLNRENQNVVANTEIFIFGSLACRNEISKATLLSLISQAKYGVFDVNLRPPDFTMDLIIDLMRRSDFIKLNDEELEQISDAMGFQNSTMEDQIKHLAEQTKTETICVTRGGAGALLYYESQFYSNSGYSVTVKDTVGAGDSFLASMVLKLLIEKVNPEDALDFACKVGALVASKEGANAEITKADFESIT